MTRSQAIEKSAATDFLEVGYYKITKLIAPNVVEIEGTWFIKLRGVSDQAEKDELKKWLSTGNLVRVLPRSLTKDARIVSDVWLGNIHINKQFSRYNNDE